MPQILPRFRSVRPFWEPVEGRYFIYERPERIEAVCEHCTSRVIFTPKLAPAYERDSIDGGYRVTRGEVCGLIEGRCACSRCGHVSHQISWPEAAFIKVQVPGGTLWAWNASHIPAIRARVRGDRVALRNLLAGNWRLARIVGRIPKFATLKRNRRRILAALEVLERNAARGA